MWILGGAIQPVTLRPKSSSPISFIAQDIVGMASAILHTTLVVVN